jgi:hypothetical protein
MEFDPPTAVQQPLIQLVVDDLTHKDGSCPSTAASAYRTALVLVSSVPVDAAVQYY